MKAICKTPVTFNYFWVLDRRTLKFIDAGDKLNEKKKETLVNFIRQESQATLA